MLAALLLRRDEVVPVGRLFDEVWGDDPPASAAHSLESYVSRLRRALSPYGVAVERRGGGYRIDLGRALLDSQVFEALVDQAAQALAAGDHPRAGSLAKEALGLWHGPVLADVTLHLESRAEAERLDELRSRAFEIRVDAELALGRHAELVGELRRLVEETPYRERLVAQLMVALYRSGRHVEALEVYERTRRDLEDDLGLRPGEELQRLAGQIVRQEPHLRTPAQPVPNGDVQRTRPMRARRLSAIVLAGALAVAATAIAIRQFVLTDAGLPGPGGSTRVALIRLWNPGSLGSRDENGSSPFVDGLLEAERKHELETEIVDLFPRRPPDGWLPGRFASRCRPAFCAAPVRGLRSRLVASWAHGAAVLRRRRPVPRHAVRLPRLLLCEWGRAQRCSQCHCTEPARRPGRPSRRLPERPDGGPASTAPGSSTRCLDHQRRAGLPTTAGIGSRVLNGGTCAPFRAWRSCSDYSVEYDDQATCERIANRQIDAGSGVVFATAGDCALGALSAAAIRGVWGVANGSDLSYLGPHILASASQRYDRLVELSVSWYLEGRLPPGGDVELGLVDDAVALVGINPVVPPLIRTKVAQEAARLRAREVRQPE